ncbi:peptidase M14 [Planotetraspora thailandica]|uniref:Peptidase M14 n=1 Tax=Planotetraspora thailandica TaxID=487172 RepID=A0A8J3V9Z4_9ACTN|nr:glycosyltransferase [Planotetraspora thailandica]GII52815.1 peptidase M14 [Planotetraspora thailandica]
MTENRPWMVVSDYPAWPSPYFAELYRHAPSQLGLEFIGSLEALEHRPGPPGVINLHRLKRLYQMPDGGRTVAAADTMLAQLTELRRIGWRIVWTVHNLLPIDGAHTAADHHAAYRVLHLADAIITHTHADARHLELLTDAPIIVAGWAAPATDAHEVPPAIRELAEHIADVGTSILLLGNLTAYKDLPAVTRAFVSHTRSAHLFVIGPPRDPSVAQVIAHDRIHLHLERVQPEHTHVLYRAADVALCPYRTDGPWEFFTQALYPSSVGTAVAHGIPVIAPDVPAVTEMTAGHPRRLYPPQSGPGQAMAAAEESRLPRAPVRKDHSWDGILAAYERLADVLYTPTGRLTVVTDTSGTDS